MSKMPQLQLPVELTAEEAFDGELEFEETAAWISPEGKIRQRFLHPSGAFYELNSTAENLTLLRVDGSPVFATARERELLRDWALSAQIVRHYGNQAGVGEMPVFALKLLPFIVPRKLRDNIGGDLAEDFRLFATRWGRPYAVKWLCWSLAGLVLRRFSPAVLLAALGMWFRRKLGL